MALDDIIGISDEDLVVMVVDGDHKAFDELYERYLNRIYRFLAPRMPGSQAEDLTSAIMTTIWKNLPTFAHRCSFSTWVYTIANNSLKNWYRKNRTTYSLSLFDRLKVLSVFHLSDNDDDFEESLVSRLDFSRAFKKLPENYQTVLLLRVVERVPADEVARIMSLKSPNAVACLLYRAKDLFRKLYSDLGICEPFESTAPTASTALTVVNHDV